MFKLASRPNGEHAAFEYPATMKVNEAGVAGEALAWDATGTLTECGATTVPAFILQADVAASAAPTVKPPVIRVDEMQEFETTMGAVNSTPGAVVVGTKLTLHTDGLTLSYDTSSGVFELSYVANSGNAVVGDVVRGYFRR